MRSSAGVGITPPNALGTPYPASSVMISSTFGAPFGGTTCAGQYGLEFFTSRSILPSNFCGGGGNCSPLIVVVALGDPGVPVVWISAPYNMGKYTMPNNAANRYVHHRL